MDNQTLQAAVSRVLASTANTQFQITLSFLSKTDSSFQFSPLEVERIALHQDAVSDYSDDLHLEFWVSLNQYADLYERIQSLYAVLTLNACDTNGTVVLTQQPIQRMFRATIVDPKDVRKETIGVHLRTQDPDRGIRIRLIEEEVYNVRSVEINTIYQACTVADAIHIGTSTFGMSNVTVVAPDNISVIDQILIPPTKSFSDYYTWLQAKYGVYMLGINHYYTGGHLYIYPPFDIQPTTEATLVVYQTQEGWGAGHNVFHKVTGTTIEVVTNKIHQVVDNASYASENVGTSVMFLRSSEVMDGVVKNDPQTGASFNDDVVLNLSLQSPKTLTPETNKTIYAHSTDNAWALASHISEHQATFITFDWNMSIPYLLRPGLAVRYNSDQDGQVLTRTGIVEKIESRIQKMERGPAGRLYKSVTQVTVRLQPEGVLTSSVTSI